jgi:Txe/YoeB family toxin of toxin-antitoxin system
VRYKIVYTKKAKKHIEKIKGTSLESKVKDLLKIISENPYVSGNKFEKLHGNLDGAYSRRINLQHRLVYSVHEKEKTIVVLSMWTHYGD